MVRLPQPGGDQGSWGNVLNDFLVVSHNNDGTIKTASISEDKLDTAVQAKLNANGGGSGSAVDSVAGKTGVVTLEAGDVGLGNVDDTSDANKPISSAAQAALNLKANASAVATALGEKINVTEKGAVDGVATLGQSGLIPATQLASGTASGSTFLRGDGVWGTPGGSGGGGTVAWDDVTDKPTVIAAGSTQAAARTAIGAGTGSSNLALGATSSTAAAGNHTHTISGITATGTPSATTYLRGDGSWATPAGGGGTVTAANITDATTIGRTVLTSADATAVRTAVGLGNVNNTSDANKPISSATQTALDAKQATLVSGTTIKTVNGTSILGSGNIAISGGGGSVTVLGASDPIPGGTPNGLIVRLPEEG